MTKKITRAPDDPPGNARNKTETPTRPRGEPSQPPATLLDQSTSSEPGYKVLEDGSSQFGGPSRNRSFMRKSKAQSYGPFLRGYWTKVTEDMGQFKDNSEVKSLIHKIKVQNYKVWLSSAGDTGMKYEAVVKKGDSPPKDKLKSPSKFGMSDDDDEIIASEYGRTPGEAILNCRDDITSSSHSTIAIEEETLDCGDGDNAPTSPVKKLSLWLGISPSQ